MSHTIVFQKGALKDYNEACAWYREKGLDTEIRFKKALDQRLQDIANNPEAFGVRFSTTRAVALKKFPYMIFYEVENRFQRVSVVAVWHEARDREVLKQRI